MSTNMSYAQVTQLTDRAEFLFKQGNYAEALALCQQVFLNCGKAREDSYRGQVARALYFAVQCNRALGKDEMAAQVVRVLETRFKDEANPRTRYWVDLALGKTAPVVDDEPELLDDAPVDSGLDAFLDELLSSKNTSVPSHNDLSSTADLPSIQVPSPVNSGPANTLPHGGATKSSMPPFLREHEVTLSRLHKAFQDSMIESTLSPDEELWLDVDGIKLMLTLHPEQRLAQLTSLWHLSSYAALEDKLEFANRINRDYILVRAAVHREDTLLIDCQFPFAYGLFPHQLVHAARMLSRISRNAVEQCNDHDVLA